MGLNKYPVFPVRVRPEIIEKIRYIGFVNSRSANKEIEQLMIKRIKEYEDEVGEITQKDIDRMFDNL